MVNLLKRAVVTAAVDTSAASTVTALDAVVDALGRGRDVEETARMALDAVRSAFGWAYGSYWQLDEADSVLRFATESGSVNTEFQQVTLTASFAEGVGLSGRAWRARDLVFVPDIGEVRDCVRAPVAKRAGVRAGVCFPIMDESRVVGTMDFFTTEEIQLTPGQETALRAVGKLVSQALHQLRGRQEAQDLAADSSALVNVLSALADCETEESAYDTALDTVRSAFGWAYGSVWKLDQQERVLRFVRESGTVNSEFRAVTLQASFAEGVGLSGRAWRERELVFVPDLAEVRDCVRAPVAKRAGVQSGVCMPIIVDGQVDATIDFFAMERLHPSQNRLKALSSVADLLAQTLSRLRTNEDLRRSAAELSISVSELASNATQATTVADDAVHKAAGVLDTIAGLVDASQAITTIAKVISGIAAQTNLLALNATIEAARAGEAGRGFAVVASEVKDLAQETASATGDVEEKIAAIQTSANLVSESVTSIAKTIESIHEMQGSISAVLEEQSTIARRFQA